MGGFSRTAETHTQGSSGLTSAKHSLNSSAHQNYVNKSAFVSWRECEEGQVFQRTPESLQYLQVLSKIFEVFGTNFFIGILIFHDGYHSTDFGEFPISTNRLPVDYRVVRYKWGLGAGRSSLGLKGDRQQSGIFKNCPIYRNLNIVTFPLAFTQFACSASSESRHFIN
ncbi:hypothetical protein RF11_12535 [Thelohanellus kitauei]|uniref:Uncharacterized protein n=1 Tax=Thelohanellus kitauei TaxID=669202 RepID=A0A0C2MAD8_THEKT|nr:hypothetical protein RF11_12535 [Thelohanellus kitauei]